jgi:hypothetical protein
VNKKKWMIATALIASSLTLGACSSKQPPSEVPQNQQKVEKPQNTAQQQAQKPQPKTDEQKLKEYIQEQDSKMKALTTEVDYYKQYVKDITLTLTPEKLQAIIDKEWYYSVTVNSIQFPKNGVLEISQSDFELTVSEERVPYSVLPEEQSLKGKIPTDISQAFTLDIASDKVSSKTDDKDGKKAIIYSFKGLTPDDVVKVILSDELTKKLGMSTKELQIRVSK